MSKNQYWGKKEEEMFIALSEATSRKEINALTVKLYPIVKGMSKIIFERYGCKVNFESDKWLFIEDAAIQALIAAHNFDASKGTKGFSYAGTVLRNYFKDITRKAKVIEKNTVTTDNAYFWDIEYDEGNEDINYLQELKEKLIEDLEYVLRTTRLNEKDERNFKLFHKYLTESDNLSIVGLGDYMDSNGGSILTIDAFCRVHYKQKVNGTNLYNMWIKDTTYDSKPVVREMIGETYDLTPEQYKGIERNANRRGVIKKYKPNY